MQTDDEGGKAWAEILAHRGPEGRAIVDELRRAEREAIAIQSRVTAAIKRCEDWSDDYARLEVAMVEVDRMRREVYRLARQ